ncbi:hypothetical protein M153_13449000632 [Pseudoloma neurophilia]|uniref:Uncharacterized protein n=1 Tax=Pseudoloma neurophilia TaxID=146866 RepID=A0A0R0LRC8_9MICR|nr:hypothetical protein M153_13449000632 [Pseudoloma neurophilia]
MIRSACGTLIKTENRTKSLKVFINGLEFEMNPLIAHTDLKFIIICADIINKYPQLMYECLSKLKRNTHNICQINIEIDKLAKEFQEYTKIFQDDVNDEPCKEIQNEIELV